MPYPPSLTKLHRIGAGLSMILFSLMLFFGFALHPNLLSLEVAKDLPTWIPEWRGNFMFHFGHLLVMMTVPFIIFTTIRLMSLLRGRGAWYGLIGGVLAIFGAFMLAVDKGALTLTLTAFQEVPDADFDGISTAGAFLMCLGFVPMGIADVSRGLGPSA